MILSVFYCLRGLPASTRSCSSTGRSIPENLRNKLATPKNRETIDSTPPRCMGRSQSVRYTPISNFRSNPYRGHDFPEIAGHPKKSSFRTPSSRQHAAEPLHLGLCGGSGDGPHHDLRPSGDAVHPMDGHPALQLVPGPEDPEPCAWDSRHSG